MLSEMYIYQILNANEQTKSKLCRIDFDLFISTRFQSNTNSKHVTVSFKTSHLSFNVLKSYMSVHNSLCNHYHFIMSF